MSVNDSVQVIYTRQDLMDALCAKHGTKYAFPTHKIRGVTQYVIGYIFGVQREDGSGNKFNVTICTENLTKQTVFIRFD